MTAAPLTPYDEDRPAPTFAEFYASHYARVLRLAMRFAAPADAEEIAQETMVRAFECYERLDRAGDLWPWLAVVARNVSHDLARARARLVCVEDVAEASLQLPPAHAPEALALARADEQVLAEALGRLRSQDAAVLRLREFEGMSFAAIGREMGLGENAARQLHHRARRNLAREFRRLGGGAALLLPAAPTVVAQLVAAVRRPFVAPPRRWAAAAMPVVAGLVTAVVSTPVPSAPRLDHTPTIAAPVRAATLPVRDLPPTRRVVATTVRLPEPPRPVVHVPGPHELPPPRHFDPVIDPPGPDGPIGGDVNIGDVWQNVVVYSVSVRPWMENDPVRPPDLCSVQSCDR